MILKRIEGATRILGAPSDWKDDGTQCVGLPVRDVDTSDGRFMLSAWEPTPDELERIRQGASVILWVRGTQHPVVAFTVD